MAGSVYPSRGWTEVLTVALPYFAASDIISGAPVRVASSGDQAVQMCQSSAEKVIGLAVGNAKAGDGVAVYTQRGTQKRINVGGFGAGASFSRQAYLGVVGTSSLVHPESGVTVTTPVLGAVNAATGTGVGASGVSLWSVGVALESAAADDYALLEIDPALLSGVMST